MAASTRNIPPPAQSSYIVPELRWNDMEELPVLAKSPASGGTRRQFSLICELAKLQFTNSTVYSAAKSYAHLARSLSSCWAVVRSVLVCGPLPKLHKVPSSPLACNISRNLKPLRPKHHHRSVLAFAAKRPGIVIHVAQTRPVRLVRRGHPLLSKPLGGLATSPVRHGL